VANSRREVCYKWKRRHSRGRQTAAEMVQRPLRTDGGIALLHT
jgi:hypothetical protein